VLAWSRLHGVHILNLAGVSIEANGAAQISKDAHSGLGEGALDYFSPPIKMPVAAMLKLIVIRYPKYFSDLEGGGGGGYLKKCKTFPMCTSKYV